MEDENVAISLCLIIIASAALRLRRERRRPRRWVRPWINRRSQFGAYNALMKELASEDPQTFRNFLRMDKQDFDELLLKVTPFIQKKDTNMRESITPAERLSLTLRYLATGDSYHSLSYLYRVPVSTLSQIIPETCDAIYLCLQEDYLKVPNSETDWEKVEEAFSNRWNFPNCVGAMDGKHISIKCPANSGSLFYNYKQFYSIVLFAIVDADYKFLYIDVGRNGTMSDGGVFANTPIYKKLQSHALRLPPNKPLPGREKSIPHLIVGDDAFPLKTYLMKPYPARELDITKRIFNYRLSRVRRIVENVFGILASRFAVFKKVIPLEPEKAEKVILACCTLHNFLRSKPYSRGLYTPTEYMDQENTDTGFVTQAEWRQNGPGMAGLLPQGGNRTTLEARDVRDELCDYFNSDGQVPWQWNAV